MTKIISFDPGLATGIAWGYYDDKTPYILEDVAIWDFHQLSEAIWNADANWTDVLVIERFVPQAGGDFTLKENDVMAIQVIGMLRHALVPETNEVYWRLRSDKAQVPDKVLKDNGYWRTGKDVQWTDPRDAMDAVGHAIGHLAFTKEHEPTLRALFHA